MQIDFGNYEVTSSLKEEISEERRGLERSVKLLGNFVRALVFLAIIAGVLAGYLVFTDEPVWPSVLGEELSATAMWIWTGVFAAPAVCFSLIRRVYSQKLQQLCRNPYSYMEGKGVDTDFRYGPADGTDRFPRPPGLTQALEHMMCQTALTALSRLIAESPEEHREKLVNLYFDIEGRMAFRVAELYAAQELLGGIRERSDHSSEVKVYTQRAFARLEDAEQQCLRLAAEVTARMLGIEQLYANDDAHERRLRSRGQVKAAALLDKLQKLWPEEAPPSRP